MLQPFVIQCETCQARLSVRKPSLLGQIVACPRCQSFVQITDPAANHPEEGSEADSRAATSGGNAAAMSQATKAPPVVRGKDAPAEPELETPPALSSRRELVARRALVGASVVGLFVAGWFFVLRPESESNGEVADSTPITTPASTEETEANYPVKASPTSSESLDQMPDVSLDVPSEAAIPEDEQTTNSNKAAPQVNSGQAEDWGADPDALVPSPPNESSGETDLVTEELPDESGPSDAVGSPSQASVLIASRLDRPVASISLEGVLLGEVLAMYADWIDVQVTCTDETLTAANADWDSEIRLTVLHTTFGAVLAEALEQVGLGYRIDDGRIVVVAANDLAD